MIRKSKTYYVSSIRGNDKNDGLTQETPFRTLQQLTGREFGPGDRVLLERGSVFEDQYLHIRGKGEKEKCQCYGMVGSWFLGCRQTDKNRRII